MKPPATSQTKIQKLFCEAGAGSRPMGFSGEKSRAEAAVGRAPPVPPVPAGAPARPAGPRDRRPDGIGVALPLYRRRGRSRGRRRGRRGSGRLLEVEGTEV